MNNKYFLFWHDYDGNREEQFDTAEELEKRYTELVREHSVPGKEYGFVIDGAMLGKAIELEPIEVVTEYKIKK
jgi:hypothetical protein